MHELQCVLRTHLRQQRQGKSLSNAIQLCRWSLILKDMPVTLESMLLKTADTFEQESARAIDRMLAALVPVITLLLASVVGVVIIAVLVPLYDLTNAIG